MKPNLSESIHDLSTGISCATTSAHWDRSNPQDNTQHERPTTTHA
ncbi:hypothetical protein [Geminisphaera colitermitum]|nr:hypothetical protein [Geminisphaera colitermitum]